MTGAREPSRRGKCRWCLRTFALTVEGLLRQHRDEHGRRCNGSRQVPR